MRFARAWQASSWNMLSKVGSFPSDTLGLYLGGKDLEFPFPGAMLYWRATDERERLSLEQSTLATVLLTDLSAVTR